MRKAWLDELTRDPLGWIVDRFHATPQQCAELYGALNPDTVKSLSASIEEQIDARQPIGFERTFTSAGGSSTIVFAKNKGGSTFGKLIGIAASRSDRASKQGREAE